MDGLVLDGWDAAQAVHEPVGVVPVHPLGGEQFDISQAMQGAPLERRVIAGVASVLYSPIVVSARALSKAIPNRADRSHQPGQGQSFTEAHRRV